MTWIKMETSLRTHPKVVTIASRLTVTRVTVLGALCHAWMVADEHADENGVIPFIDLDSFDALVELPGLGKAMVDVGWLIITDRGIEFPNYLEHNGSTAKERAQSQRRQRKKRLSSRTTVTDVTLDRDTSVTREEKNREEKNREERSLRSCASGKRDSVDEFTLFWRAYPKKKAKADAQKAWNTTAKVRPPIADLLQSIENQKASEDWQRESGSFIPYPATWLRAGQWDDEVTASAPPKPRKGTIAANNQTVVQYLPPGTEIEPRCGFPQNGSKIEIF